MILNLEEPFLLCTAPDVNAEQLNKIEPILVSIPVLCIIYYEAGYSNRLSKHDKKSGKEWQASYSGK